MKFLFLLLTMLCQLPPGGVTPEGDREVGRRGAMAVSAGNGIQAGEDELIKAALAPPEDDSGKWFLTLVTQPGCQPCDRFKADLLKSPVLKNWVDVANPNLSHVHYQAILSTDKTQEWWLKSVRERINAGGYPAFVLQPPASGEYGKPDTVVAILHGYGAGETRDSELVANLKNKVVAYVKDLHRKGLLVNVVEESSVIEGRRRPQPNYPPDVPAPLPAVVPAVRSPPPFVVLGKKDDQFSPSKHDWPPPTPLTAEQIKAVVKNASDDFVTQEIDAKSINADQVREHYLVYLDRSLPQVAKYDETYDETYVEPEIDLNFHSAPPILSASEAILASLIVASLIGVGLYLWWFPLTLKKPLPKKKPIAKKPVTKRK